MHNNERRVVVTGIGAITPIGSGVDGLRAGLRAGKSAIAAVDRFDCSQYATRIAAQVNDFDPSQYLEPKRVKRLDRYSQFAVAASKMAIADAGITLAETEANRVGVCLGTGIGGFGFAAAQAKEFNHGGIRAVSPMLAPTSFVGSGSCNIAIELGLTGPATANGDSCAAAPNAIGHAADLIRAGYADAMLAGGAEAPLEPLCFGAFVLIRAMSHRNDDPQTACRPFDKDRDGFVLAEGSGMLFLEEYGHARRRGASIYGELLAYGSTNDSFHITQPRPDGSQAARCISECLQRGHVKPSEIGYINAHGSSTQLNEATESLAIRTALGEAAASVPMSGTKGYHGHGLGATGAWEAAISLLALKDDYLPENINLSNLDPEAWGLNIIRQPGGLIKRVDYVLSNSFGFGGINACLLFGRVED